MPALVLDERIYETSVTTGTGEYTLAGAVTGFQPWSVIAANQYAYYFATDDTNWEIGIGTYVSGPDRLQRTAVVASSNSDAAVNWGAGTKKIRCGLPAFMALPRQTSKSVAGSSDVTLTALEQRCQQLIFTGLLTGNISVIVDTTKWDWDVYNNTSGSYTLSVKTSGGSGVVVGQGRRTRLACDGTNVVAVESDPRQGNSRVLIQKIVAAAAATVDFSTGVSGYDSYELEMVDVLPGTDNVVLNLRVSTDGGSNFLSTNIYSFTQTGTTTSSAFSNGLAAQAALQLSASNLGTGTGEYLGGKLSFQGLGGASRYKGMHGQIHSYSSTPVFLGYSVFGAFLTTTAINALRLYASSGNLSGTFALYGIRN
jgi:hypothetical protein